MYWTAASSEVTTAACHDTVSNVDQERACSPAHPHCTSISVDGCYELISAVYGSAASVERENVFAVRMFWHGVSCMSHFYCFSNYLMVIYIR
jgi:hypothetical protein